MQMPPDLRDDIIALLPELRAFSGSLAGDPALADDLVQETLLKVWSRFGTFRLGTNLRAWLFTILRNEFYTHHRKRRREVLDGNGHFIAGMPSEASQPGHMEMADLRRALGRLSEEQREALILSAAAGFSYEEVAEICGCAMGTVKSRINRARSRLSRMLANGAAEQVASMTPPHASAFSVEVPDPRKPADGAPARDRGGRFGSASDEYRSPDEICRAEELDWAQKLHLLNGLRLKVRRDMDAGAFDRARGDALIGKVHLALRHVAGAEFLDDRPGT